MCVFLFFVDNYWYNVVMANSNAAEKFVAKAERIDCEESKEWNRKKALALVALLGKIGQTRQIRN